MDPRSDAYFQRSELTINPSVCSRCDVRMHAIHATCYVYPHPLWCPSNSVAQTGSARRLCAVRCLKSPSPFLRERGPGTLRQDEDASACWPGRTSTEARGPNSDRTWQLLHFPTVQPSFTRFCVSLVIFIPRRE